MTGADGFIGSHLTEMLLAQGHSVRALSQYNSFNNWGWLEQVSAQPNLEIVTGDVRDPFLCEEICTEIDTVFNLAALIAIPYSYRAPQSYVETNINGAMNLCQAGLKKKVSRLIQVSTSEVYGTAQYVPIDEKHPLQPQSPYSASKIASDAMAMSYYHAFGLPVCVARPFNTFGPRQSARAVIPTIISQLAQGKTGIKLGALSPTRDFNFVSDTCRGLLQLAECDAAIGQVVNIGSGQEYSIQQVFDLLKTIMRSSGDLELDEARLRPENSEVQRLLCDSRRITSLTGYKPEVSFEAGLKNTVQWFADPNNLKMYKAHIYNV